MPNPGGLLLFCTA